MRESKNNLTIIGTLKNKKVDYGTTKAGDPFISVNLTVQSEEEGKISVHKVSLWAKTSSKLAKGFETVAKEYKTIDVDGIEAADRIKVDGTLEMNEYISREGTLKTSTRIKGIFVSRVTDKEIKDVAGVKMECVVMNNRPELKEGSTTGRTLVKLYSVGYNNTINEFENVVVEKELSADYNRLFPVGSTANFYLRLDNYAKVNEEEVKQAAAVTFGQALANVGGGTVKEYVNQIAIHGGMQVLTGKYTNEEIQEMSKLRELAKNEKMSAPVTPPATTSTATVGFGDMPF